jgi:ABC-type uncharacterized transport system permease subunit
MDFGIDRGAVLLFLAAAPLALLLGARTRACVVDHPWAHVLVGGLVGALVGLWVHALPCLAVRCDRSPLDNVPLRVALLCTSAPLAAAAATHAFVSKEQTKVPPVGVPYIVGVRVSHVPSRWVSRL